MALLCYALLVLAFVVDLLTPQLFIAAILLNGPIALSSLALQRRLTTNLVIAAEIASALAAYANGLTAGHHWSGIAIGDRLLVAASFVLVGALSIKTQEYAREAGVSAGRMRQIEIEKLLREAIGRVRETLNVEIVQRAVVRESVALLDAAQAWLIVREAPFSPPLIFAYKAGAGDVDIERRPLSTTMASLFARAVEARESAWVRSSDLLGRLALDELDASEAIVAPIATEGGMEHVLSVAVTAGKSFSADALPTVRAFAEQAAMALEQAYLFRQLGERSEEIARQKDELADRSDVIRDIVYALAHDLRTPLAAAHVTMTQALSGAYGELPTSYREILQTALAANHDQRRIVETLLLVARYEAGETSMVCERVVCRDLLERIAAELRPVAEVKGIDLRVRPMADSLVTIADPHEIGRAVANLVANAIDATPRRGHVTLWGSRDGETLAIAVEDDGFGVPEAQRANLFQRFGGRPASGTGLGLYIVRRIAEKYDGTVRYTPLQPRGSRFTLTLPAAEA